MYRIFVGRLIGSSHLVGSFSRKNHLQSIYLNLYSFLASTNIMPPKRKAAAAKTEPEDLGAGGDQVEPIASTSGLRRGRPKKEPEVEVQAPEEREKKGRAKRVEKIEEPSEVPKITVRKQVPAKAKGNDKENGKGKEKVTKAKVGRAKKPAEIEEPPEEIAQDDKPTKKRGKTKNEDANGVDKPSRKKKADPMVEEPKPKGRKKADKEEKPEKPAAPFNSTMTDWEKISFACEKKSEEGRKANLKISCWNVGGLKSWVKKDCLKFLEYEDPDILCVQETKCSQVKLPEEIKNLEGYHQYWCSSNKEGYAGVGLLCKKEPIDVTYGIKVPEQDEDGRCITAEFDSYYVVCVYVPNAGRKLVTLPKRLKWNEAFKDYINTLDNDKPVIICGDMNVAHSEIDLARPANNTKNAGFTVEEREGMTDFLQDGYVDTFRRLYPDKTDVYTFWTYMSNARARNIGWRLDYVLVSERIMEKVCDTTVRSEILGSDHCPITLFINI